MKLPARIRTLLAILWRTGLFVLAFALISAFFLVPVGSKLPGWEATFPIRTRLCLDLAGAAAILAATWVMTRFVDRRPFRTIGFAPDHALRDTVVGLGIGTGWLGASVGGAWAAGLATFQPAGSTSGGLLLAAAVSVLFNVLTQQLLLCGYIFQTIRSRTGFTVTVAVSAVLFSTYHAGAFQGAWLPAVNVFAGGVLFCLAYGITGNLWLPVAIHFAWNLLLGPVLGLTVSGSGQLAGERTVFGIEGPDLLTGGAFGLEGGLLVTFTTGTCVAALMLVRRQLSRNAGNP